MEGVCVGVIIRRHSEGGERGEEEKALFLRKEVLKSKMWHTEDKREKKSCKYPTVFSLSKYPLGSKIFFFNNNYPRKKRSPKFSSFCTYDQSANKFRTSSFL